MDSCTDAYRIGDDDRQMQRCRLATALLVGILLIALCASPVAAHAQLDESSPANGEQVEEPPDEIVLQFTGDGIQAADVEVVDDDGERVDADEAEIDAENSQIVRIPLDDAGDGVYTVTWEVLATDGHTTQGSFFFVVGEEELDREAILELHADDDPNENDDASPIEAVMKGFMLVSVLLLVGVPITMIGAVYPAMNRFSLQPNAGTRRAARLLLGAAVVLFVSAMLLGIVRVSASYSAVSNETIRKFLGSTLGQAWLAQLIVASATVALTILGVRERLSTGYWLGGAVGGGLIVQVLVGWTSHSASALDGATGVLVDVGHVVGGALWLGGLLVMALVVPRLLAAADPDEPARVVAAIVRRFSVQAIAGVSLAVLAGLLLTAWHVPDLDAVVSTLYGSALGIKVALVACALGLGGFARVVLLRRLRENPSCRDTVRSFTRSVRAEVAILLIVVLISGLITSAPTAVVAADGSEEGGPVVLTGESDDIETELRVTPGEVGPNVLDVQFMRDGEPVDPDEIESATLLLRNDRDDVTLPQADLEYVGNNTYSTVESFPTAIHWDIRITAQIDGEYVSTWVRLLVAPQGQADHVHHGQTHEQVAGDTELAGSLQLGAILAGLAGLVALIYELITVHQRGRNRNE